MKKFINLILTNLVVAVAAILVVGPSLVIAATPAAPSTPKFGQALEIAPPVIYLTVNRGQTVKTQIFLRDISGGDLVVTGQANDFVAAGEDGTPKVILDKDTSNNPYSLKNWITPPSKLLLVPREIKTMQVTIKVPTNASPGGHYGIIRFTATPPNIDKSGVSLSTSLGALVLLTVNGKVSENLSVKEFSVNHGGKSGKIFQSAPLNFVERLQNSGNIHEQPVGQVTITDMFGKKLAALNVNLPPRNILPQSIRKFQQPLDSTVIGNKKLFGRYHAKLSVTYGKDKKVLTSDLVFWVIPYKLIAIVIAALIAGFFVLRYAIRRYNRYIINRTRRHHR